VANWIRVGGGPVTGVEVGGIGVVVGGGLAVGGRVAGASVLVGGGNVGGTAVGEAEGKGAGGTAVDPPQAATIPASRIRLKNSRAWFDLIAFPPLRSSFQ
jgi:hypothetical protein